MTKQEDKGLWSYLEKWQKLARSQTPLSWQNTRLANAFCGECRFCCGEQDSSDPFPMALLPEQIDSETKNNFFMLNSNTAGLGAEGCKSLTSEGCGLPEKKRPVACGIFPIVLANGSLYLYQTCPAAMFIPLGELYELGRKVAAYLERFTLAELRHISINLSKEVLSKKYIDLHIRIFDDSGKNIVLE